MMIVQTVVTDDQGRHLRTNRMNVENSQCPWEHDVLDREIRIVISDLNGVELMNHSLAELLGDLDAGDIRVAGHPGDVKYRLVSPR